MAILVAEPLSKEQPKADEQPSTQSKQEKDKENNKVEDESAKAKKRDPQIEEIDRKVKRLREYYDIKYKIGEGIYIHVCIHGRYGKKIFIWWLP